MRSFIFKLLILIMLYCCSCQQQDDHLVVRINEKLPVHSKVVNLRNLLFGQNQSDSKIADFSLAKRDEFPYMYFLISHSSRGLLTIRKEIDRDELCRLRRCRCDAWCDLELEIIINSEQYNIELITIRIIDQNDHKPVFSMKQLNLTIVENAQIGAMIKLEAAIDHDQGQNSIIGYSLVSLTSLPFSLRYDLIRGDLSLVVDQTLDREAISSYKFDIIARDGDNQTGVLHVFVTIDDINDSPPKFLQTTYLINNISESISIDSIICRVHAIDDDDGINGEINYYLIKEDDCFQIDQITGDIRVRCLLDYETKPIHRLEIEAKDRGEGYKTDYCTVLINLSDENDNAPMIDTYPYNFNTESNSIKIFVNESIAINSLLLSITIIDQDSGENGRVSWKIDRLLNLPFELIRLTESTGELRTKDLLDRELRSTYNLILEAHDHGRLVSKSTLLYIDIIVLDENDHTPKFTNKHMKATISEHVKMINSNGYEVYQLQANDYDQGVNGEIVYSIINQEKNLFNIDSSTGVIRALIEFDRKQQDTYILQVEARDKGTPSLSSQGTIVFKIISRNQFSPICDINTNHNISWSILENSELGTIVGTISCRDDDQDELNGRLRIYPQWFLDDSFNSQDTNNVPFEIVTRKSNISESTLFIIVIANGVIDREKVPFYRLLLTVSDHGNPSHSINISISIEILDENDNCPQLHKDSSFLMINRDVTPKQFITHLIAIDNDKNLNQNVKFQLVLSTSLSFVYLHPNGTLLVQTDSNGINDESIYVLQIKIDEFSQPKLCYIPETLRLFIGSNRTNWTAISQRSHFQDKASTLTKEEFQQDKRMADAYINPSSLSTSSSRFKQSSSVSFFTTQRQIFVIFIGSTILMFIVLLTSVLCFIDCMKKKSKQNHHISMIKANEIDNHSSLCLTNGTLNSISLNSNTHNSYPDNSLMKQYKSLAPMSHMIPIIVAPSSSSSSSSRSSSSFDSTTRANTAHNRAMANTYTYTALSTSDDFMPIDFDANNDIGDDTDGNGVELMMTTV